MQRRQSLIAFGALAALGGCAGATQRREARGARGAGPALPVPPVSSGEGDEVWLDASRRREIPLRVRWPVGAAPCALVVYSHGLGGSRTGGDVWGRAWQAAGMAVVHVQHPGSDTDVLREGTRALFAAATSEQLVARVADMRFVVDEVLRRARDGGAWARVRADAIGAAGHSFGAHTTQALAGQRYASAAASPLADPRLRAFLALSPMTARNDPSSESQQMGAITRPFLAITGSLDGDPLGSNKTGADRARVYDGLPPGQRALLWLEGADHMTFGGNGQMRLTARRGLLARADGAIEAEPRHHAVVAQITTHWWRWRLLGDAAAQAALSAPNSSNSALGLGPKDRFTLG